MEGSFSLLLLFSAVLFLQQPPFSFDTTHCVHIRKMEPAMRLICIPRM
jgi:hypothetical protein